MLSWLEGLPVSEWVATSDWGYPLLLAVHSMGMAIVVGLLVILDLRVLGYAKAAPIPALARMMPLAWAGFGLNLVSGVLLFASVATRIVSNWPFLAKMAAILAGGAVSWALWRELKGDGWAQADRQGAAAAVAVSARARALAAASIAIWLGAVVFGRLIAYVMDAALLKLGT